MVQSNVVVILILFHLVQGKQEVGSFFLSRQEGKNREISKNIITMFFKNRKFISDMGEI